MAIRADADEAGRNVTGLQLALVLGGLVVAVLVLWFFFLRGGNVSEEEVVVPEPTATEAPVASPSPSPEATPQRRRRRPVETFEVFAPKDPFQPLVLPGAAAAGGITGDETTGTETTTTTGETTVTTGETTTTDGTTTTVISGPGTGKARTIRGPQGGARVSGHRIKLIDVFERAGATQVRVEIDGTVYTVSPGETFASSFKLLSASGSCASMLFGDDQFSICEGEEILK